MQKLKLIGTCVCSAVSYYRSAAVAFSIKFYQLYTVLLSCRPIMQHLCYTIMCLPLVSPPLFFTQEQWDRGTGHDCTPESVILHGSKIIMHTNSSCAEVSLGARLRLSYLGLFLLPGNSWLFDNLGSSLWMLKLSGILATNTAENCSGDMQVWDKNSRLEK